MKRIVHFSFLSVLLLVLLVGEASAQMGRGQRRGSGGWGMGTKYSRMYNPSTVETVKGEITKIDKITPFSGMYYGIHVFVKTDKGELSVHLGPGWFIENQDTRINVGDKVEIKGSQIVFNGEPTIIAAEVRKGEHVLVLRDENGFPVWAGWRRGGGMRGMWSKSPATDKTPVPSAKEQDQNKSESQEKTQ